MDNKTNGVARAHSSSLPPSLHHPLFELLAGTTTSIHATSIHTVSVLRRHHLPYLSSVSALDRSSQPHIGPPFLQPDCAVVDPHRRHSRPGGRLRLARQHQLATASLINRSMPSFSVFFFLRLDTPPTSSTAQLRTAASVASGHFSSAFGDGLLRIPSPRSMTRPVRPTLASLGLLCADVVTIEASFRTT
ncbi:hypothetical protein L1887_53393 [Cichorium endivia]|nr:hypothetical protein L1887_53393 [Cichorium endivia]